MTHAADTLTISETFYSVQGEGTTIGCPAVFLRMTGCVLNCQYCDTTSVWKHGTKYTFDEVDALFEQEGYFEVLNHRNARLVITGGDPMIQQDALAIWLREQPKWKIECETEGCIMPHAEFLMQVDQFNVSPKLASSAMPLEKRRKMDVLKFHAACGQDIFKFPVRANSEDGQEVIELAKELKLDPSRVCIMPVASSRAELFAASPSIVEFCKLHGWRFSSRLQVVIYDQVTGV